MVACGNRHGPAFPLFLQSEFEVEVEVKHAVVRSTCTVVLGGARNRNTKRMPGSGSGSWIRLASGEH